MAMLKGRHEENTAALSTHRAREFNSLVRDLKCISMSVKATSLFCVHIVAWSWHRMYCHSESHCYISVCLVKNGTSSQFQFNNCFRKRCS